MVVPSVIALLFASGLTTFATASTIQQVSGSYIYIGCYNSTIGNALSGPTQAPAHAMTPDVCTSYCASQGFGFAGLEFGQTCTCGEALEDGTEDVGDGQCGIDCSGDGSITCGGEGRLTMYQSG